LPAARWRSHRLVTCLVICALTLERFVDALLPHFCITQPHFNVVKPRDRIDARIPAATRRTLSRTSCLFTVVVTLASWIVLRARARVATLASPTSAH
jgi:hypothetical protein